MRDERGTLLGKLEQVTLVLIVCQGLTHRGTEMTTMGGYTVRMYAFGILVYCKSYLSGGDSIQSLTAATRSAVYNRGRIDSELHLPASGTCDKANRKEIAERVYSSRLKILPLTNIIRLDVDHTIRDARRLRPAILNCQQRMCQEGYAVTEVAAGRAKPRRRLSWWRSAPSTIHEA